MQACASVMVLDHCLYGKSMCINIRTTRHFLNTALISSFLPFRFLLTYPSQYTIFAAYPADLHNQTKDKISEFLSKHLSRGEEYDLSFSRCNSIGPESPMTDH